MRKYTFELDYDMVDKIIRETLLSDYSNILEDIAELEKKEDSLEDHQRQDLKDFRMWAQRIKDVLEYYIPAHEYRELFK